MLRPRKLCRNLLYHSFYNFSFSLSISEKAVGCEGKIWCFVSVLNYECPLILVACGHHRKNEFPDTAGNMIYRSLDIGGQNGCTLLWALPLRLAGGFKAYDSGGTRKTRLIFIELATDGSDCAGTDWR